MRLDGHDGEQNTFESISCSFNLLLTFYDYWSFFVLVPFFIE